ncbi:MAG TPA: NAD(P)/FAD-dependent oxidoreductase [Candidatus Paceibacterota bacterium]
MNKIKIIIIGGGFGGTYTAKYLKPLARSGTAEITLISKDNYFLFTPLLHEVATGGQSMENVAESIEEILRGSNINFLQDEIVSINIKDKKVITKSETFSYDYLVISSGSETNYYGIQGAKENSFTLKNLKDAISIRKNIIDLHKKTNDISSIVVGAGPTGVELAAELIEFLHTEVTLVSAGNNILLQYPEKMQKLAHKELLRKKIKVITNMEVARVEQGKIVFKDRSSLSAKIIIWVAGVKPITMNVGNIEYEKNGRMKVDEYLRINPNVYALGDISGTLPMLAQVAVQQGKNVAENIILDISGKLLIPFKFHEKGLLISLGQWYAIGKIGNIIMRGPIMWWLWRTIYLFNFHSWRNRMNIALDWTINLFSPRDITEI